MLFLQIKQAEVALADGRLDEAYQLITGSSSLRTHRRGQAIVRRLVEALVKRGQEHLDASRRVEAMSDCDKAQRLGGNQADVLALRNQIENDVVNLDRARRAEARVGVLASATQLVDSAVARKDLDRAVSELLRARGNGCDDRRLRELDANVRTDLRDQIESALNQGRLDQVDALMDRLARLDPEGLPTQQLNRAIEQTKLAWQAVQHGRADEAQEILRRISAQLPDAKWITEALKHLETAAEAMRTVRGGPLGLLVIAQTLPRDAGALPVLGAWHRRDARVTDGALPMKFILQVDGAGSFLVVRQPSVTIGPISSSQVPDVALIAEPTTQLISIERVEDDYFLRCATNGSKLLNNGDRIALSPRCRLMFGVPNPSSTSAVLDLTTGRFPRADIRRVILLDRDLVIGPGATSHVRADYLSQPLVLCIRDGRLWCRSQQLALGSPATIDGVSLVVTRG